MKVVSIKINISYEDNAVLVMNNIFFDFFLSLLEAFFSFFFPKPFIESVNV